MQGEKKTKKSAPRFKIDFLDLDREKEHPKVVVYVMNRARKIIESSPVDEKGLFNLSDKSLKEGEQVVIGPKTDDLASLDRDQLATYRASQFKKILENGPVVIPKKKWYCWHKERRCMSGSVSHCYPYPWRIKDLLAQHQLAPLPKVELAVAEGLSFTQEASISDARIAYPLHHRLRYRCETVCDGIVEVYRRTCCCIPWVIYDPRLTELIEKLKDLVEILPPTPWPPGPDPDPGPLQELPVFKNGTLDELRLNAAQHLHALRTLPPQEQVAYINARHYLFCKCGAATKVAQGFIQPDGEFNICWWEWPRLKPVNCHDEYAFVVKQVIDGGMETIYDGLSTNNWFHYGDDAKLVSHHLRAQSCRHNEFPGEGAFVLLQDIGLTPSFNLKTPSSTGWDRVATPGYNDGLAFPANTPAAAKGKYLDRNWGGTLRLRYHFSESMKSVGAKYYRVSVIASDTNGNPIGERSYLSPQEWKYYVGAPNVEKVSLGPHIAGSQQNLYEIPYDADRAWHSGQYHALLDTTQFSNGRFLLTVEVFDNTGKLLRPTGTLNPGGSAEASFTYRRWYQEVGPTLEVPHAALSHMLWWDNRKAKAQIIDLRTDSSPNTAQCQFMVGSGSTQFSVGYRAYHEEPMFLLDHRVWWRRGLGGPSGVLTSPHPNPDNVGVPPNSQHQSGSNSFSDMLAGLSNPKCSFSVNLHVNVKTFNGIGTLNHLDAWDQAAFALEMIS